MARHVLVLLTFSAAVFSCQENSVSPASTVTPEPTSSSSDSHQLAADRDVWVTVGADAVPSLSHQLKASAPATLGVSKNGVATLRVRESQLLTLARVMHDQFHRCGGFEMFDTEAQAQAALEPAVPLQAASAITYTIDNGPAVQKLIGSLTASNVLATVTQLATYKNRYYNSATGAASAQWLKGQWETLAQGRTDVTVEAFAHAGWSQPSIILTVTGQTAPSEVVVLGAHLDSINISDTAGTAPGADDDASGIATLTEVIRVMMVNGFKPNRTVKFMGYSAEEVGLRGSKEIAAKFKANAVNVVGVMQLDMTNFHGSSSDIVIYTDYTDASQNAFVSTLVDTYVKVPRSTDACGYGCSDHASWNANGYRTSMPFEAQFSDYNPKIHTADDTLANSGGNVDQSVKFAKLAAAFVGELAKGGAGDTGKDTTPPTASITSPAANASVSGIVTITAEAADNVGIARVNFFVDGNNVGTDQTPPYTLDWDTTDETNGTHVLTVVANDSSTNKATSNAVTVTVAQIVVDAGTPDAGTPVVSTIAVYDDAKKTIACAGLSKRCDSDSALLGRGALGPEVHAPNTLGGSCADGSAGRFHVDESIDRLVISSVDGSVLKAGARAKIEATVWAYTGFVNDKVDLYSAADVSSPKWVLIGTLSPTVKNASTLSTTFTLPTGATQAIRARIRYKGTAGSCGTGTYDDHDDLVFAVAP